MKSAEELTLHVLKFAKILLGSAMNNQLRRQPRLRNKTPEVVCNYPRYVLDLVVTQYIADAFSCIVQLSLVFIGL